MNLSPLWEVRQQCYRLCLPYGQQQEHIPNLWRVPWYLELLQDVDEAMKKPFGLPCRQLWLNQEGATLKEEVLLVTATLKHWFSHFCVVANEPRFMQRNDSASDTPGVNLTPGKPPGAGRSLAVASTTFQSGRGRATLAEGCSTTLKQEHKNTPSPLFWGDEVSACALSSAYWCEFHIGEGKAATSEARLEVSVGWHLFGDLFLPLEYLLRHNPTMPLSFSKCLLKATAWISLLGK